MINTIIWDLDGTLLNTLDDLSDSVNYALEQNGFPTRQKSEIRLFLGNGIRNLVELSAPKDIEPADFERTFQTFKAYYADHCQIKTRPYEGMLEIMAQLKEKGYKQAIVSNKVHSAVQELNKKFFHQYINIAIGETEGVKRKPYPDMVFAAMQQLGSTAADTIYIGDSEVDMQTANNAELPCISVIWGFRDKVFLEAQGAQTFAEKPEDILKILE